MTEDEIAMAARRLLDDEPAGGPAVVDPATCPHPHSYWTGSEVVCARCGEFTGGVEHSMQRHPSSLPPVEADQRGIAVAVAVLAAMGVVFTASAALTVWVTLKAADWVTGWFWQVIA